MKSRGQFPIRFITAVLASAWLLASSVAVLASGVPEGGVLDFAILRNGEEIGRHILRFEARGRDIEVRVEARVDFWFGFIPLYRFDHRALEVWRDGALVRLTATTQDNGDDFQIEVRPDGAGLALSVNGETTPIDAAIIPASLWNIALVRRNLILDPADGELMSVAVTDVGADIITVRGRDVAARHYVMTGDFERDLWYDRDGVLMQVRFKGDDGSDIHYQLR